ncbi:AMP-binding protein [Halomonas organivorans]|uniref:Long-subunit acyl-CoA synthetase (AMP-forming) n=1 Tax=Halomonas organivorans TaxID=257772 RepID=A0A7W5BYD1_9GAMM|nr:AMP-binding protein [Halomonas organivorans]MBB3140473.1 long-subunit acyl-CoA synthetase (AMP-forming) [Halomonas organivorans]
MSDRLERFLDRLATHAERDPAATALEDGQRRLSYGDLANEIDARRARLAAVGARRVGLALDNGVEWALWDLAMLADARVAVPVPAFFGDAQRRHLVERAGLDAWIGSGGEPLGFIATETADIATRAVPTPPALHPGTTRITFTSGTSAAPKGVCLDTEAVLAVAMSLAEAVAQVTIERHLAMLPLATLLENLGGLYLPLWLGASVALPSAAELGWQGASGFDADTALAAIERYRPHSLILVPQQLQALVDAAPAAPESLQLVAVGGARVAAPLLERALADGWPVAEGYGLSECASVVCLNRPGETPRGVGRPLPHARVRLSDDGEVEVSGATMLGYLGEPPVTGWHATGDLGHWAGDALMLEGRRREVFITAYGRNVDPQWVEGVLVTRPGIAQAMVHGEAMTHNRALIVPAAQDLTDEAIAAEITAANATLPDYARVGEWRRCAPFTPHNDQLTANGRLRRTAILAAYRDWLHPPSRQGVTP